MAMKDKYVTVGDWLSKGRDPAGLHVTMTIYLEDRTRTFLGTVKGVIVEPGVEVFSLRLVVHYFNGEPWPLQPLPCLVEIIQRI